MCPGSVPILVSPWFFEEKAWTPGLLILVHMTWVGLEDAIPPPDRGLVQTHSSYPRYAEGACVVLAEWTGLVR